MGDLNDFNDPRHRTESAAAVFQKGVYHLLLLLRAADPDAYGRSLRTYQCLFELCHALLLLDLCHQLERDSIPRRVVPQGASKAKVTRDQVDPACIVSHSTFENEEWSGFGEGHPLSTVSRRAMTLHKRSVGARHSLLYRPFLLAGRRWEDCNLSGLLGQMPTPGEVHDAYMVFTRGILDWSGLERKFVPPGYFMSMTSGEYQDQQGVRPTETLLLTYARLLCGDDEGLLADLAGLMQTLLVGWPDR
jgi:hypothetical protein